MANDLMRETSDKQNLDIHGTKKAKKLSYFLTKSFLVIAKIPSKESLKE